MTYIHTRARGVDALKHDDDKHIPADAHAHRHSRDFALASAATQLGPRSEPCHLRKDSNVS